MDRYMRSIYRKFLSVIPDKVALNLEYFIGYHRWINFKNPKYFGEKIQYLKLYGNLEQYRDFVDKYKVRDFISKIIGEEYLIPLIATYDKPEEIEYEKLPNQFAIKLNYGSGYNLIVKDKNALDKEKTNQELTRWLKEDFYKIRREYQYKGIEKKILVEQYMADSEEKLLDYKFYCFDGKIEFVEVDFDRFSNHTMNFYDLNWNLLPLKKGKYENYKEEAKKPDNFDQMVEIAQKLSSGFQFVRVDLYDVNGKIFFGELTYTPASGITAFQPKEKDLEIAQKIKLYNENLCSIVATMFCQNPRELIDKMNIQTDCVIVSQGDYSEEKKEDFIYHEHRVRYIETNERGISRSRNMALRNLFENSGIVLIADDDIRYQNGYAEGIQKAYENFLRADGIIFDFKRITGRYNKKMGRKINFLNLQRVASPAITFKKDRIGDIQFDEEFGAGSSIYTLGEENIFISDCLKRKMQFYNEKFIISEIYDDRPSTWYRGINEKFLISKGANYGRMFGNMSFFFCFYFWITKYKNYKENVGFIKAYQSLFGGCKKYKGEH